MEVLTLGNWGEESDYEAIAITFWIMSVTALIALFALSRIIHFFWRFY